MRVRTAVTGINMAMTGPIWLVSPCCRVAYCSWLRVFVTGVNIMRLPIIIDDTTANEIKLANCIILFIFISFEFPYGYFCRKFILHFLSGQHLCIGRTLTHPTKEFIYY